MSVLVKLLKFLFGLIVLIVTIGLFWGLLAPITLSPVYDFPEPKPFSGNSFYNPYEDINRDDWKKGNFQIQTRLFMGIHNGRNNSTQDVYDKYGALDYDIITVSDYMTINYDKSDRPDHIPVYEHGISIHKQHEVLIGAKEVLPFDFPIYKTIHNKQFILDLLRDDADAVAIAHPNFSVGYSLDDMRTLTNYDLVESLNYLAYSLDHWDAALSAGKPVFILSNDDAHNLRNEYEFGVRATVINTKEINTESVTSALKRGAAYGYNPKMRDSDTLHQYKVYMHSIMPIIEKVKVSNDSLYIKINSPIDTARFIGQDGKDLEVIDYDDKSHYDCVYLIKPEDSYVRAQLTMPNLDRIYLNPIIRTEDGELPVMERATVNWMKTALYRIPVILLLIWFVRRILRRRRKSMT